MTVSVIIPTYNRPLVLKQCLDCLMQQEPLPTQILVVDASVDTVTQQLCARYPKVTYLRNPAGRGNTPNSRNLALKACKGDIIAFLDDDAFAHPGWLANMVETYRDPACGGVAGRALNHVKGEESQGLEEIGKLKSDGTLTGNFAANPGRIIEVDHMIGCNMSLRREIIARLGGFRDDFHAGPFGICEETEICVRAKRLGYRLFFNPAVCADHMGAQQPGGKRFSPKYTYFHAKNNLVMLIRNWGLGTVVWRHLFIVSKNCNVQAARKVAGAVAHLICGLVGLAVGLVVGIAFMFKSGYQPEQTNLKGRELTRLLSKEHDSILDDNSDH